MPPKNNPITRQSARLSNARQLKVAAEENSEPFIIPTASSPHAEITNVPATSSGVGHGTEIDSSSASIRPGPASEVPPPSTPRRPVQRLDSLRSGSSGAGETSRALRYLPQKVSRRNQEEREALERSALAILEERKAEASRLRAVEGRRLRLAKDFRGASGGRGGRGRSSRGLSSGVSRASRNLLPDNGSGLSNGAVQGPSAESRSEIPEAIEDVLKNARMKRKVGIKIKKEGATKQSTDVPKERRTERSPVTERKTKGSSPFVEIIEEEPDIFKTRCNIDYITISSDSGEDSDGLARRRLKPVRLDRHEHVDRPVGVNTDASSARSARLRQKDPTVKKDPSTANLEDTAQVTSPETKKTPRIDKDVEFVRNKRLWKGVYPEEDGTLESEVKHEPHDMDAEMTGLDTSYRNDQQLRPSEVQGGRQPRSVESLQQDHQEDGPRLSKSRRKRTTFQVDEPVLQTNEDQAEWTRYLNNRVTLMEELSLAPENATESRDKNLLDESEKERVDRRQDQVYMFQLPPLIPNLILASARKDSQHQDDQDAQSDLQIVGQAIPPAGQSSSTAAAPIKIEDANNNSTAPLDSATAPELNPDILHAPDSPSFTGAVGILTIYESGVSALSWGGVEHELNLGCAGELLQEVVVADVAAKVESGDAASAAAATQETSAEQVEGAEEAERTNANDEENDGLQDEHTGKGMAMGQLCGRFVVTPAWAGLFERTI